MTVTTPCIEWKKTRHRQGYGYIRTGSKSQLVHRWIWEKAFGPIPEGLKVLHKCDNPPCFRLSHLELGTQKENVHQMLERNRQNQVRGAKCGRAKLDEMSVRRIRELLAQKVSQKQIAAMFGVSKFAIYAIHQGHSWRWLA